MLKESILVHSLPPEHFPLNWASDWGEDNFSYWMSFNIFGIRQCFRWITPGDFLMGAHDSENEKDSNEHQHPVTISKGYWMAETTCTQELWGAVTGSNPSRFVEKNKPVEMVSWDDCINFINKLNDMKKGLSLRLPTEAEWEYACRAGSNTPYANGNSIDELGWYYKNSNNSTHPVAMKKSNNWGLYDMHGNVWEWCADWYGEYPDKKVVDPTGPETGEYRILRGGSWILGSKLPRSACRNMGAPTNRRVIIGFRLVHS